MTVVLPKRRGSLALGLAFALALGCLVVLLLSVLRMREAAEVRRAVPPPIYTEPRPEPKPALAPLPKPVFFPDAQAEDESEWLR